MSSIEELYPTPCAFCKVAEAYPPSSPSAVPESPDPEKVFPQCQLILSTPHILAFLDILPLAPGHILVITRDHYKKLSDLHAAYRPGSEFGSEEQRWHAKETARAFGEWMPVLSSALSRATGVEDWNVVQNNGERAAQVVPHIHFHLIPRYQEGRRKGSSGGSAVAMSKSWTMFGRGAREELDEDEGAELAKILREAVRLELGEDTKEGGKSKL